MKPNNTGPVNVELSSEKNSKPDETVKTKVEETKVETRTTEVTNSKISTLTKALEVYTEALKPSTKEYDKSKINTLQLSFMNAVDKALLLDYEDFRDFMKFFIRLIIDNKELFNSEKMYLIFTSELREGDRRKNHVYVQRYFFFITASVTFAQNARDKKRISAMIDIPTLVKGFNKKAADNIATFFSS